MKKKINRNCSWKISDDKSTNKNFKITVLKMLKELQKKKVMEKIRKLTVKKMKILIKRNYKMNPKRNYESKKYNK